MKKLIADLKTRLSAITAIKYIDEDWGQLDYYSPNQPVKWPCVIMDVNQVNWSNQGEHVQIGLAQVSIRIADMRLANSNPKAPASQQANAASIFDLISDVYSSLHGWTADSTYGPLTRTLTRKVNRDDGIREFEMVFSVQLIDDSAKINYDTVDVPAKIHVSILKNGTPPDETGFEIPPVGKVRGRNVYT